MFTDALRSMRDPTLLGKRQHQDAVYRVLRLRKSASHTPCAHWLRSSWGASGGAHPRTGVGPYEWRNETYPACYPPALDHYDLVLMDVGETRRARVIVSQPYAFTLDAAPWHALQRFCSRERVYAVVSASASWWLPGKTTLMLLRADGVPWPVRRVGLPDDAVVVRPL